MEGWIQRGAWRTMFHLFGLLILAGQGTNFKLELCYFLLSDMLYCCASSNIVTGFSNICEADAGLLLVSILLLFLAPRFHMNGNSSNLHLCVLTLEYCTFVWQPIVDFFVDKHLWVLAAYCVCGLGCVSYLKSFWVCASLHIQCVLVSLRRGCQSKIHRSQQFLPPRFCQKEGG